jgi:hypothetical protein
LSSSTAKEARTVRGICPSQEADCHGVDVCLSEETGESAGLSMLASLPERGGCMYNRQVAVCGRIYNGHGAHIYKTE